MVGQWRHHLINCTHLFALFKHVHQRWCTSSHATSWMYLSTAVSRNNESIAGNLRIQTSETILWRSSTKIVLLCLFSILYYFTAATRRLVTTISIVSIQSNFVEDNSRYSLLRPGDHHADHYHPQRLRRGLRSRGQKAM